MNKVRFGEMTQQQLDCIVKAIADAAEENAEHLARLATEETGFGNAEDKTVKNLFASKTVYEKIKDLKTVGLINHIENDKDWKRIIVQIHVDKNEDIILVPRDGKERFVIGKPTDIVEKFEKMKKYYTAIIPKAGSEQYKVVDLRYKGQIICK